MSELHSVETRVETNAEPKDGSVVPAVKSVTLGIKHLRYVELPSGKMLVEQGEDSKPRRVKSTLRP